MAQYVKGPCMPQPPKLWSYSNMCHSHGEYDVTSYITQKPCTPNMWHIVAMGAPRYCSIATRLPGSTDFRCNKGRLTICLKWYLISVWRLVSNLEWSFNNLLTLEWSVTLTRICCMRSCSSFLYISSLSPEGCSDWMNSSFSGLLDPGTGGTWQHNTARIYILQPLLLPVQVYVCKRRVWGCDVMRSKLR